MKINLNDNVEVVLTDVGAAIWNEYEKSFAKYNIEPRLKQSGDVLRQKLWSLMSLYGPHIHLGGAVPFEMCAIEWKGNS